MGSAYSDRMAGLEKDLRRGMHGRWGGVHPILKNVPVWVIAFRTASKQRLHWSLYAVLALLVTIPIVIWR